MASPLQANVGVGVALLVDADRGLVHAHEVDVRVGLGRRHGVGRQVEADRHDDVVLLVDERLDVRLVLGRVLRDGRLRGGRADLGGAVHGALEAVLVVALVVQRADVGDDADLEIGRRGGSRRRDRRSGRRLDGRRSLGGAMEAPPTARPSRRPSYRRRRRWTAPRTGSVPGNGCACFLLQVRGSRVRDGLLPMDRDERRAAAPKEPPMCRILPTASLTGQGPDGWSGSRIGPATRFRAVVVTSQRYAPAVTPRDPTRPRQVALGRSTRSAAIDPAVGRPAHLVAAPADRSGSSGSPRACSHPNSPGA